MIKRYTHTVFLILLSTLITIIVGKEESIQPDTTVYARKGSRITLTLESPNSKERMWELQRPVNKKMLRQISVSRRENTQEIWEFDTLDRGTTYILLQYASIKDHLTDRSAPKYIIEVTIE